MVTRTSDRRSARGRRACRRGARGNDPEIAAKFVAETGVDALAVSIGNIHFLEGGKVQLDFDVLEHVHDAMRLFGM